VGLLTKGIALIFKKVLVKRKVVKAKFLGKPLVLWGIAKLTFFPEKRFIAGFGEEEI